MDDGIVFFELWDNKGKKIATVGNVAAFPSVFRDKPTENFTYDGYRNAYRETEQGSARLIIKTTNDLFQGNRAISRACAIYISLVPKFQKIIQSERQHSDAIITRFAHNLGKLQTRFKGNLSRLVPDKARARPYVELVEEVKKNMLENPERAAHDIAQMSHRATDLDAQLEALRIISEFAETSAPIKPIPADLRRVMFRLSSPFIEELRKKRVTVHQNIPSSAIEKEKVFIAHSLFNAAIWQLLDNASKYVLEGTEINIEAALNEPMQILTIEMVSVCIEENEYEHIFEERYKGRHAKNKAGSGIGMYIVRKALNLMGARISVVNLGHLCYKDGFAYCTHRFTIAFKQH
jgi:signal transduction histidine kinase